MAVERILPGQFEEAGNFLARYLRPDQSEVGIFMLNSSYSGGNLDLPVNILTIPPEEDREEVIQQIHAAFSVLGRPFNAYRLEEEGDCFVIVNRDIVTVQLMKQTQARESAELRSAQTPIQPSHFYEPRMIANGNGLSGPDITIEGTFVDDGQKVIASVGYQPHDSW